MSSFVHTPGNAIECLSIALTVFKDKCLDDEGNEKMLSGFGIGGGIDQDYRLSPQNFTDNGIYVTNVVPNGPGDRAGLRTGDKILQCNGRDFTMVTHKKAVEYIKRSNTLQLLVARRGVTSSS